MRTRIAGPRLREEKSGDEEGVLGQLDDAGLAVAVDPTEDQPGFLQSDAIVGIDAVVAIEGFLRLVVAIQLGCPRGGADMDVLQLSDQGTSQRSDGEVVASRVGLGVVGVSGPEDVAGVLDDRVLKAPSGANQGQPRLPSVLDGRQGARHALVRAARRDEDSGVSTQAYGWAMDNRFGGYPFEMQLQCDEGIVCQAMRFVGAVKVAHDSYHGLGCHATNLAAPARLRVQD